MGMNDTVFISYGIQSDGQSFRDYVIREEVKNDNQNVCNSVSLKNGESTIS